MYLEIMLFVCFTNEASSLHIIANIYRYNQVPLYVNNTLHTCCYRKQYRETKQTLWKMRFVLKVTALLHPKGQGAMLKL